MTTNGHCLLENPLRIRRDMAWHGHYHCENFQRIVGEAVAVTAAQ